MIYFRCMVETNEQSVREDGKFPEYFLSIIKGFVPKKYVESDEAKLKVNQDLEEQVGHRVADLHAANRPRRRIQLFEEFAELARIEHIAYMLSEGHHFISGLTMGEQLYLVDYAAQVEVHRSEVALAREAHGFSVNTSIPDRQEQEDRVDTLRELIYQARMVSAAEATTFQ